MLRFKKTIYINIDSKKLKKEEKRTSPEVPEGMWCKCPKCGQILYNEDRKEANFVCPKCGHYFRMEAYERIEIVADEYTFQEWDKKLPDKNPLHFKGYEKKLAALRESTGLLEAVVTGKACIYGEPCALIVCDSRFMMAKDYKGSRTCNKREITSCFIYLQRRGKDAGRDRISYADGKNSCCIKKTQRSRFT